MDAHMSRRHSKKRSLRYHWREVRSYSREARSAIAADPRRALIVAASGVALLWLVLVKSLSFTLAEISPEAALWFNPNMPRALLNLAESKRAKLIEHYLNTGTTVPTDASTQNAAAKEAALDAASRDDSEERDALRAEIRGLARRAIALAPMSARGYRILAEATEERGEVRFLMQEAFARSRRESAAVTWLMTDSFERGDFADVVAKADILLRTRAQLSPHAIDYLGDVAANPEGRHVLVSVLAGDPVWRLKFFKELPKNVPSMEVPLELMVELKDVGSPPSPEELAPFLSALVTLKHADLAYNAWLQLVSHEKLAHLGLLNNSNFAEDPNGLPFDWTIWRGKNTLVGFVPLNDQSGERALRFSFGGGRAKFPETSQIVLLGPGRYQLTGSFRGLITSPRGLRWELRCIGAETPLAETDMIFSAPQDWQTFTLDIEVPSSDDDDCPAQKLRLYHAARSASEELMTGEISFRGIRLTRHDVAAREGL
jgi:hypothetical protein